VPYIPKHKRKFPTDHLGNKIEVGDQYFYGAPPTVGIVVKVLQTAIVIFDVDVLPLDEMKRFMAELPENTFESLYDKYLPEKTRRYPTQGIMKCKSPDKGICLNKNILL
jgi:hypothetical protein